MNAFQWVAESAPLPGFAIRATIVLAAGIVLAWLVRKRSAQLRHRLWTATLLLLLLLPGLAIWAPQWEMPLLPAAQRPAAGEQAIGLPADLPAALLAESAAGSVSGGAATAQRGRGSVSAAGASPRPGSASVGRVRPRFEDAAAGPEPFHREGPAAAGSVREAEAAPANGYASEPAAGIAGSPTPASRSLAQPLLLWAIGCLGGLASLAAGHLRFRALVRRARPLGDPRWIRDMRTVGTRLGLHRDVRLLVSEAAGTPMTGGFRKPVILLPATSATWEAERRRVVLMHELVHVRRRDALRQLLSGIVLALYWFHPLSWVASRLAAACREEACDERVLELGSRPSEYARQLVSLATRTTSARFPVAALSMARQSPSRLEKRIMAILRPRRPRASAPVTGALLTATVLLGVSAAIAHPVHRMKNDAGGSPADPGSLHAAGVAETHAAPDRVAMPSREAAVTEVAGAEPGAGAGAGVGAGAEGALERVPGVASEGAPKGAAGEAVGGNEAAADAGAATGAEPGSTMRSPGVPPTPRLQEVECVSRSAVAEDFGFEDEVVVPITGLEAEDLAGRLIRVSTSGGGSYPDGDRIVWQSIDDVRLCMRVHGDVELGDGEIRSMAVDGWILLESEGEKLHRLIIRPGDGDLEHEWSVGGESRPFGELAREWRDGMLAVLRGRMEIQRIRGEKSELEDRIARRRGEASEIEAQAAHDGGVVAGLRSQVAYRQSVVADLLNQVSYHQEVLLGMRDEIAYHRGVVSGMRDEIAMHRERDAAFREVKASYEARLTEIIPRLKTAEGTTRQSIENGIRHWEARIRAIDEQVQAYGLNSKVRKIETDIRNYRLDVRVKSIEQQIVNHEHGAGLEEIEAAIEEQFRLLDEVVRRTEEAISAREGRLQDAGQDFAAYGRDDEVARLEQQLRGLDADENVAMIEQLIEDVSVKLLELIRGL